MNYMYTRRSTLSNISLASILICLTGLGVRPIQAEDTKSPNSLHPGTLDDVWLGSPTAKITLIEYASLTCPHCADFHQNTWPILKERYIDTGKVRFAVREFPLDLIATAAFMMARCDGAAQYYQVIDLLLDQQKTWALIKKPNSPVDAMAQTLQQIGFTKEKFDLCLRSRDVYTGINTTKQRGADLFGIETTPTFLINGDRYVGALTIEVLETIIQQAMQKVTRDAKD